MKTIGLTGPSGAGKSFCSQFFKKLSIPCIDADEVYHNLLCPPSDCVDELAEHFGKDILNSNGEVDRKALANTVFSDKTHVKLNALNSITHKYVINEISDLLNVYSEQKNIAAVIDAPLLFEAEVDKMCDFTIAVISDEEKRLERIMARDDISAEDAFMRLKAQKSTDFYTKNADYTVTNNADLTALISQLEDIMRKEKITN